MGTMECWYVGHLRHSSDRPPVPMLDHDESNILGHEVLTTGGAAVQGMVAPPGTRWVIFTSDVNVRLLVGKAPTALATSPPAFATNGTYKDATPVQQGERISVIEG